MNQDDADKVARLLNQQLDMDFWYVSDDREEGLLKLANSLWREEWEFYFNRDRDKILYRWVGPPPR